MHTSSVIGRRLLFYCYFAKCHATGATQAAPATASALPYHRALSAAYTCHKLVPSRLEAPVRQRAGSAGSCAMTTTAPASTVAAPCSAATAVYGMARLIPSKYPPTLELEPALVACIHPKNTTVLMKVLAAHLHMPPHWSHLKRIRKVGEQPLQVLEVALCPLPDGIGHGAAHSSDGASSAASQQSAIGATVAAAASKPMQLECAAVLGAGQHSAASEPSSTAEALLRHPALPPAVSAVIESLGGSVVLGAVPRHAPLTREQCARWNEVWPVTWKVGRLAAFIWLLSRSNAPLTLMRTNVASDDQLVDQLPCRILAAKPPAL